MKRKTSTPKPLKSVNIKGSEIKIVRKDIEDLENPEKIVYGEFDQNEKTITISTKIDGELLQITFFHEFIHALFHELHISQRLSDDLEEIIADNVATALTKLMRNELIKYRL